jgi:hypothetical protein
MVYIQYLITYCVAGRRDLYERTDVWEWVREVMWVKVSAGSDSHQGGVCIEKVISHELR